MMSRDLLVFLGLIMSFKTAERIFMERLSIRDGVLLEVMDAVR